MGWPEAGIVIALILVWGAFGVAGMARNFAKSATPAVGGTRLAAIEESLDAMRSDLAELKQSIAELDRLLKSVG